MGLLDMVGTSWDDPRTAATLAAAAGLMRNRNVARGLLEGMGGYVGSRQNSVDQEMKRKAADAVTQRTLMEAEAMRERQEQARRQAAAEQEFAKLLVSPQMQASQAALSRGGGPTVENAGAIPQVDQSQQMLFEAMRSGLVKPLDYFKSTLPKPEDAYTLSEGQVRYVGGRKVAEVPKVEKPDEFTAALRAAGIDPASPMGQKLAMDRALKLASHPQGVSVSYGSPVAGVDTSGNPVFFQPAKGGGQPAIVQGVTPPKADKPLTEAQAKAATFASQMAAAERELGGVKFDQTKLAPQLEVGLAAGPGNLLVGQEAQRVRQAQEQWAESYLRFKTGAATTKDEVNRNIRTFFPQPGDGPQVVEQKARMRAQAQQDLEIAATGKAATTGGAQQKPRRKYNPQTGLIE